MLVTTTGTNVTINSLRGLDNLPYVIVHPQTDFDLLDLFTEEDIEEALTDLQSAVTAGDLTVKTADGVSVTDVTQATSNNDHIHDPSEIAGLSASLSSKYDASNPSGYQTAAQVTAEISNVVGGAPGALDTLNELADALGDDPNFAATIATQQSTQDTNISNNASAISTEVTDRTNADTALQNQITTNDTDISNLQSSQSTQDTNISNNSSSISNNQSNIATLQTSQGVQDTAIALNTAKVSADGSVGTHSDVDLSGIVTGDQLQWDGSTLTPVSITNGFTVFPIWAEENGGLASNQYEWSWGNGSTGAAIGIPLGLNCELFAVSFNAETFGTSVSIDTQSNGTTINTSSFTSNNQVVDITPIAVTKGSRIGFRTNTVSGSMDDCRVCAWFRVKAISSVPTVDRAFVTGNAIAFSSTTWADIPGMTETVTLSATGNIEGNFNYSASRSGGTNAVADFRVVIGASNGFAFPDTLSIFNDNGTCSHFVDNIAAGTYTVKAQCQTTQPITLAAASLRSTAQEV